jgi:hypothetical protein
VKVNKRPKASGFAWNVGCTALWLREHWILTAATGLAAIAIAVIPRYWLANEKMTPAAVFVTTAVGILAALSVATDKFADHHSTKIANLVVLAEESAGHRVVAAINSVLDNIHDAAFTGGAARDAKLETLRIQVATAAALLPVAKGVRATYYPLTREEGFRIFQDPKSYGRHDEATTIFSEKKEPEHLIWKMMDARDSACEIHSYPEECGIDWPNKPYKTFISVPVKAGKVLFGMLSINATNPGDLTELDRVATVSLARIMGAVLALQRGPRLLAEDAKLPISEPEADQEPVSSSHG